MEKKLIEWSRKVRLNKKKLDRDMFDCLIKNILSRLEKDGYEKTFNYLKENYEKGKGNRMVGVILLRNNSKQIKDKLWSLEREK